MTNLMEQVLRSAIGYETLLNTLPVSANYPPHNIEKLTENHYRLTLAVAGFSDEELAVSLHKGILTVEGRRDQTLPETEFLYRGMALRDFKRDFRLGTDVTVTSAETENGLLIIDLMREVPESEKPKLIPINR